MSTFFEDTSITRRQFLKGTGLVLALAAVGGVGVKWTMHNAGASATNVVSKRIEAVYVRDVNKPIRKAHQMDAIQAVYHDYLSPGKVLPFKERSALLFRTKYGPEAARYAEQLKDLNQRSDAV